MASYFATGDSNSVRISLYNCVERERMYSCTEDARTDSDITGIRAGEDREIFTREKSRWNTWKKFHISLEWNQKKLCIEAETDACMRQHSLFATKLTIAYHYHEVS